MNQGEITIYQTVDGNMVLNVKAEKGCVWLMQKHVFELFEIKRPAITK